MTSQAVTSTFQSPQSSVDSTKIIRTREYMELEIMSDVLVLTDNCCNLGTATYSEVSLSPCNKPSLLM